MPLIVVLPCIAAFSLNPGLEPADKAYPTLMALMPEGLKGLVFAALVAAIVSSLGSMSNSISTIFTLDVYSKFQYDRSQKHYVKVGRIVSLIAMVAAILTARPLLGELDQAFQYIQEFTGFFTPGVVALFLLGMFWSKTTARGALAAAIGSAILSLLLKLLLPAIPFMDRVGFVFIACIALAAMVSLMDKRLDRSRAIKLGEIDFSTGSSYNIATVAVSMILVAFYVTWW